EDCHCGAVCVRELGLGLRAGDTADKFFQWGRRSRSILPSSLQSHGPLALVVNFPNRDLDQQFPQLMPIGEVMDFAFAGRNAKAIESAQGSVFLILDGTGNIFKTPTVCLPPYADEAVQIKMN